MTDIRLPLALAALSTLLLGCPTGEEEDEDFPLQMCAVMAEGEVTALIASTEIATAPTLDITEDPVHGYVNAIAGLSDAEQTHVAFAPGEDGELVLFADVADVVVGLFEDGIEAELPEGSPNSACEEDIPEHWHLDDLAGGATYTLHLGLTAVSELDLVLAHHEGDHEHEE